MLALLIAKDILTIKTYLEAMMENEFILENKSNLKDSTVDIERSVIAFVKLASFLFIALSYFILLFPYVLFRNLLPDSLKAQVPRISQKYAKLVCFLLGIKVDTKGFNLDIFLNDNFLVVSNHLSYVDILVMQSLVPFSFITSVEIQKTFFLGHICQLAGCVFVERRKRDYLVDEISEIAERLVSGSQVVLFAEGTSTNGNSVKRFKRPLFQSAQIAGKNILCLTLNYEKIDDVNITVVNRDKICWYGRMSFLPHFFELLKAKSIKVKLDYSGEFSPGRSETTTEIAAKAHFHISKNYIAIT